MEAKVRTTREETWSGRPRQRKTPCRPPIGFMASVGLPFLRRRGDGAIYSSSRQQLANTGRLRAPSSLNYSPSARGGNHLLRRRRSRITMELGLPVRTTPPPLTRWRAPPLHTHRQTVLPPGNRPPLLPPCGGVFCSVLCRARRRGRETPATIDVASGGPAVIRVHALPTAGPHLLDPYRPGTSPRLAGSSPANWTPIRFSVCGTPRSDNSSKWR